MLIAVTGGIGCGKSVVCRILEAMGFPVYDCDSRASAIMDNDDAIKQKLIKNLSPEVVDSAGNINRKKISEIVFSDYEALQRLNAIVHTAVKQNLAEWYEMQTSSRCFVETAILYQSGLDKMVDDVWEVFAPVELKLKRVMSRNGFSREQVEARISSQEQYVPERIHSKTNVIVNDDIMPILPQIEKLLDIQYC